MDNKEEVVDFITKNVVRLATMSGETFIGIITGALITSKDADSISPEDLETIAAKAYNFHKTMGTINMGEFYEVVFTKFIPELSEFIDNIIKEKK